MYPHTRKLLAVVVEAIADLPNRVSIRGHTDALPFAAGRLRQLASVGRPRQRDRWSVRKGQILPDPAGPVGPGAAPSAVGV